jgi:hypothetical protein
MFKFGLLGRGDSRPSGLVLDTVTNVAGTGTFDPGAGDDGTVVLTWEDAVGNTNPTASFRLFKDNNLIATIPAGTLTYTDTDGIEADTAYQYKIQIVDTKGYRSNYSSPISVSTPSGITGDTLVDSSGNVLTDSSGNVLVAP